MEGMRMFPDKYFSLAMVDPPYGINVMDMAFAKMKGGGLTGGASRARRRDYSMPADWDAKRPPREYFDELFRVSRDQVIFGGNYFADILPPTKSFVVWDKKCSEAASNSFADCELAWASKGVARVFRYVWSGFLQGDMKKKEERIHPTQKPIALYRWLLSNYAAPGVILDTHVGSASSLCACYDMGYEYVGFEINPGYYKKANARLRGHRAQTRLIDIRNGMVK
jgi:site-specific DNA-methyltransferase (adenine-specific)